MRFHVRRALEGPGILGAMRMPRCLLVVVLLGLGLATLGGTCGGSKTTELLDDAEFDPASASDAFDGVEETVSVAQTFTVINTGRLEEMQLLLTQGNSADSGTIFVEIRPTDINGIPDPDPASAIVSIAVDTSTLPPTLTETFTNFELRTFASISVASGEVYAIVVDFGRRSTSTDTLPIAFVLGMAGDQYPDGDGFTGVSGSSGGGFFDASKDYIFTTTVRVGL